MFHSGYSSSLMQSFFSEQLALSLSPFLLPKGSRSLYVAQHLYSSTLPSLLSTQFPLAGIHRGHTNTCDYLRCSNMSSPRDARGSWASSRGVPAAHLLSPRACFCVQGFLNFNLCPPRDKPSPRTLCCSTCPETPLLEQQNTKKLYGTKNVCVHSQGKFWPPKTEKDPKTQLLLLRSLEQKQGTKHTPCTHQHLKGGQKPLPNPWTHPYPHPI